MGTINIYYKKGARYNISKIITHWLSAFFIWTQIEQNNGQLTNFLTKGVWVPIELTRL